MHIIKPNPVINFTYAEGVPNAIETQKYCSLLEEVNHIIIIHT